MGLGKGRSGQMERLFCLFFLIDNRQERPLRSLRISITHFPGIRIDHRPWFMYIGAVVMSYGELRWRDFQHNAGKPLRAESKGLGGFFVWWGREEMAGKIISDIGNEGGVNIKDLTPLPCSAINLESWLHALGYIGDGLHCLGDLVPPRHSYASELHEMLRPVSDSGTRILSLSFLLFRVIVCRPFR